MPAPEATLLAAVRDALSAGPTLRLGVLFGSVARGRAGADSDVDVAIVPEDPALDLRAELDLQVALERAAGRPVDLVRLDRASTILRWQVATTGVPLLEGRRGAWRRFVAEAAIEHADFAPALARAADLFRRRLAGESPR